MQIISPFDPKTIQLLGNIRDKLLAIPFTSISTSEWDSKIELLLAEIRDLISSGGGSGDITGNGAANQLAIFSAAKNIQSFAALQYADNTHTLSLVKTVAAGLVRALVANSSNTGRGNLTVGTANNNGLNFLSYGSSFPGNFGAAAGVPLANLFEISTSINGGTSIDGSRLLFYTGALMAIVGETSGNNLGLRFSNEGLKLSAPATIHTEPNAFLELIGSNANKATIRIPNGSAQTSNIQRGNVEFVDNRLKIAKGTTEASKETIAYLSDLPVVVKISDVAKDQSQVVVLPSPGNGLTWDVLSVSYEMIPNGSPFLGTAVFNVYQDGANDNIASSIELGGVSDYIRTKMAFNTIQGSMYLQNAELRVRLITDEGSNSNIDAEFNLFVVAQKIPF